ncbi:MFS transporter small subunit [Tundrisphaera sp. TA3]
MTPGREELEATPGGWGLVAVAWTLVTLPLLYGVVMTFRKAMLLFVP